MYPYKIQPIQKDNLYNIICTSQDGEIIYLNENTYVTIHREAKNAMLSAIPLPYMDCSTQVKLDVNHARGQEPNTFGLLTCANPKCKWPGDEYQKQNMTEYDGKFFCSIDCAQAVRGKVRFDEADKEEVSEAGTSDFIPPWASKYSPPWHPKYDACVTCHSTKKKHVAKGLCTTCYFKNTKLKISE